jgi:acyl carrier protein
MMLDQPQSSSRAAVSDIVGRLLARRSVGRPVSASEDLRELLTSMDMVSLMLTVEAELDLKIPERALTPANFRSVSAIEALVTDLLRTG